MTACPNCRSEDVQTVKSWDMKTKRAKRKTMHITAYNCRSCGYKFRKIRAVEMAGDDVAEKTFSSLSLQH